MAQRRVTQRADARSLVWVLLMALALMGLTITRQQVLGPLHLHSDQPLWGTSTFTVAASSLTSDWLKRWRQQQAFGHSELRMRMAPNATLWPPSVIQSSDPFAARGARVHTHDHDDLERHHHAADDDSVVPLDGAAEASDLADSGAAASLLVVPVAALHGHGLAVPIMDSRTGPWPADSATTFVSWSVTPPLRPPAL